MKQSEMKDKLERVAALVLRAEGKRAAQAAVQCVTQKKIQELNRIWRGIDAPTDVLSFDEQAGGLPTDEKNFLGEIVLCPTYIRTQARAVGVAFVEEILRLTIHGALHLLGHDHAKKPEAKIMFAKQEKYVIKYLKRL